MESRISLLTLGVRDLERSLRFYRDGLGFPTTWNAEQGVIFFQTSGTRLALYPLEKLAEDIGADYPTRPVAGFSGITLAHNTREQHQVDEILAAAEAAGGQILKPAQKTFWGGYAGYFADPDGHLWEIAHGAFPFNEDGSLQIP